MDQIHGALGERFLVLSSFQFIEIQNKSISKYFKATVIVMYSSISETKNFGNGKFHILAKGEERLRIKGKGGQDW